MKNFLIFKHKTFFLIVLLLLSCISMGSMTTVKAEQNTQLSSKQCQKAFYETAKSYWECGTKIQYSIPERLKGSDYFRPEDLTAENAIAYSDCSGFARNVYMETFGIELPKRTWNLETYARNFADEPYVVETMERDEYNALAQEGKAGEHILENIEVGDLVLMRFNQNDPKGHIMMGYEWIYDENGNKTDMWLIHCTGNNSDREERISAYDENMTEGAIHLSRVSNIINNNYSKMADDGKSKVYYYALIRPLAVPGEWLPENGDESAYNISENGNRVFYEISPRALARMNNTATSGKKTKVSAAETTGSSITVETAGTQHDSKKSGSNKISDNIFWIISLAFMAVMTLVCCVICLCMKRENNKLRKQNMRLQKKNKSRFQ